MTIRFRLTDHDILQQQTLRVTMCLLEHFVQPALHGSSLLLSARRLQQLPAQLRSIAQGFIGLYVVANGQGTITRIATMQHRLGIAEQDQQFGLVQGQQVALRVTERAEIVSLTAAS